MRVTRQPLEWVVRRDLSEEATSKLRSEMTRRNQACKEPRKHLLGRRNRLRRYKEGWHVPEIERNVMYLEPGCEKKEVMDDDDEEETSRAQVRGLDEKEEGAQILF